MNQSAPEYGSGSESLTQELTNRMPPGRALGWSTQAGAELQPETVQALLVDAREVLLNLGILDDRFGFEANPIKAPGQAFARAALRS